MKIWMIIAGLVIAFLDLFLFPVLSPFVFITFLFAAVVFVAFGSLLGRKPREPPLSAPTYAPPPPPPAPEKEAIREGITKKEIIVKIRCSYCGTLFDEALDKCPQCGAKN